MIAATSIARISVDRTRACQRCGIPLEGARPSTIHCRDCDDVKKLDNSSEKTRRRHCLIALREGWDIDDPAGGEWPDQINTERGSHDQSD